MGRRRWVGTGVGAALVGAVGVGLLVAPTGASAAPVLPPVSPEDLVASVMAAQPAALQGTVTVDNNLGLPALPGLPQAANGDSEIRVWSGGEGRKRVAIPSSEGEKTLVSDGTTRWAYDSTDRTAVKVPEGADGPPDGTRPGGVTSDPSSDPVGASGELVGELRRSSTVTVDGTAEVAGRAAYTLVLTPLPTERTLLRQVRVAVDAESRMPLQLTVLANGSAEPALQIGFDDVTFGPQDPSLFTFTPPPGTTVTDGEQGRPDGDRQGPPADAQKIGDGWDTVIVGKLPEQGAPAAPGDAADRPEGAPDASALSALGTPVSGPWGSGRVITTAVATVVVADDGRIAAGAVPQQVLTEALAR